jgi:hypothetical protein
VRGGENVNVPLGKIIARLSDFIVQHALIDHVSCGGCHLEIRMRDGARVLTLSELLSLRSRTHLLEPDDKYDPLKHKGAFTMEKRLSAPGACSWREASESRQDLYLYQKQRSTWNCTNCGYENTVRYEQKPSPRCQN